MRHKYILIKALRDRDRIKKQIYFTLKHYLKFNSQNTFPESLSIKFSVSTLELCASNIVHNIVTASIINCLRTTVYVLSSSSHFHAVFHRFYIFWIRCIISIHSDQFSTYSLLKTYMQVLYWFFCTNIEKKYNLPIFCRRVV